MPLEEIVGNAVGTSLSADITNAATSFSIVDATGWPTGATAPFVVTLNRGQPGAEEKIKCSTRTGLNVSVASRGYDGTVALAWSSGTVVEHTISAAMISELNAHVNNTSRDDHPQYLNTSRHDLTARHSVGTVVPAGTPGAITLGDAAAPGVATTVARADHVHAAPTVATVRDAVLPPGAMMPYGGASAPSGWLLADGSTVARASYAALFAVVGTAYNIGGEAGTDFRLPSTKGRALIGFDAGQTEFNALGKIGGEKTHVLTTAELANHVHNANPPATASDSQGTHHHTPSGGGNFVTTASTNFAGLAVSSGGNPDGFTSNDGAHTHTTDIAPFDTASAGSGTAHNNLQPYLTVTHIIKT